MADDVETWETFTKGDTVAVLYGTIEDREGNPISLTGKTLTVEGRARGEDAAFDDLDCTVTDAAAGEFESDAADLCGVDEATEYRVQVRVATTATPADFFRTDLRKVVVRDAATDGG